MLVYIFLYYYLVLKKVYFCCLLNYENDQNMLLFMPFTDFVHMYVEFFSIQRIRFLFLTG